MRGRGGAALALVLAVSFAPSARADAKDPTAAEALFLAGRDAMKNGDLATACAKFAESDRLDPAAGTAANLADCEEKLGKIGDAWAHWKEAVELLPPDDTRLGPMRARAATIEKRVPRLTVHAAPTLPHDATMQRDGVDTTRASLDTAIPENPGKHVIVVTAPGHASRSFEVTLAEGESREIVVDAGEATPTSSPGPTPGPGPGRGPAPGPSSVSSPPAADEHPGRTTRILGFGLVGLGVVGAGIGTVTGIVALSKKSALESDCFPTNLCNADGASAASTGHTMALVSTVSFVVAGAALAGGAVLVLTSPRAKTKTGLAPLAGPHLAGVALGGSF